MNTRNAIFSNLFWKFAERIGAQSVSLIVSIILARLLLPEEYGVVSILLIFINIANVFVSEGFSTALVQKRDADDLDDSSMFFCSLCISIVLYLLFFIGAPYIESFYKMQGLGLLLRILALKLPIAAVNSIQHAFVQRTLQFRKFFFSTLFGTILSGVIGVLLAYLGFGAWALVFQYLINSTVDTLVLFFTINWRPKFIFSWCRAKLLLNYGWKITIGSLLNTIYAESRALIIGKKYSSADLAFYNKGVQFPQLIVTNIDSSIGSVLFPALSKISDEKQELKNVVRRSLRMSSFIIFPCMAGLAAVAVPLISLLLTDKWMFSVYFLQVACITQALQPINTANIQLIKASGRSDIFLKMEITKKISGILILLSTMWFGVKALALGEIIVVVICNIVNAFPNKKLINYGFGEQVKDLLPFASMAIVMHIMLRIISSFLNVGNLTMIIINVIIGILFYSLMCIVFKIEEFNLIKNTISSYMKNHR